MTDATTKQMLRNTARQARMLLTPSERQKLDESRTEQFCNNNLYRNCEELFCYVSLPQEPDTWNILRRTLSDSIPVAVPRCIANHKMQFYQLQYNIPIEKQLTIGTYHIAEPSEMLPSLTPSENKRCICLIPGLAFDLQGGRLGYGGGYYDRFLQTYPFIKKLGVTAQRFLIDKIPMERTDVPMDGLVLENTCLEF
ncbi:MAG: 5-formyltetrahydrofolate cyclo-ligase [Ruminococcus sp.]|nr:5-formyltetrahydrofolate cyclo-ligase [Ruminococcus sp.]